MIHCFHVCQELYAKDDPLSVKYSIAPTGSTPLRLINGNAFLKAEKAKGGVLSPSSEQGVDSGESTEAVTSVSKPPDSDSSSCDHQAEPSVGGSPDLLAVPEEAEVDESTEVLHADESSVRPL